MDRLKSFILSNFSKSFITLFVPFFTILSLIYIINISKLSSKITLDGVDFFTFYLYVLPDIIFSTIPLAFIGGVINAFANLSQTNEITAIFSIGYKPKKLIQYIAPIAILFTILIAILGIFISPYANQKMNNFKSKKIFESNLKVLPKKLSQHFGNSHIFIEENIDGIFKSVTMFRVNNDKTVQLLVSKNGYIKNDKNGTSYLSLNNGSIYKHKIDNFEIVDFKNMKIYNSSKFYSKKILTTLEFWDSNREKLYYYILISISPVVLFMLYIAFGIYNPRYQKNRAYIYILMSVILIYIPSILTRKSGSLYMLIATIIVWFAISILVYKKRVAQRL